MTMLTTCGGAFGSGGFGSLPAGAGFGLFVVSARAVTTAAIDITFAGVPQSSDAALENDVLNPARWTLSVRAPYGATVRLVQTVLQVSESVVRVVCDGPLTAEATYRILVSDVVSETGVPIDDSGDCNYADFLAFGKTRISPSERLQNLSDPRTDLANDGTFILSDTRDYALDRGLPYLKKRVIRRATTALGGFFHLPDYGFSEPLKPRITPDLLRRMQTRAQSQILLEPDVVSADVTVRADLATPGAVIVTMRVTSRESLTVTAELPINITG